MVRARPIEHRVEEPTQIELSEEDKKRIKEGNCPYVEQVFRIFCCPSKIKEGACDYQGKRIINWEGEEEKPLYVCLLKEKRLYD